MRDMLRLHEPFLDRDWRKLINDIDRCIVQGIQAYIESDILTTSKRTLLCRAFSELALLKRGLEPDYNVAYLPIAYAFAYLPRRVSLLAAIFEQLSICDSSGYISVLDVGAGPDVASVALSFVAPQTRMSITSLEPSDRQFQFGASLTLNQNVTRHRVKLSIENM